MRQEDCHESETSVGYLIRLCFTPLNKTCRKIKHETQSKWSPVSHRHWYLVLLRVTALKAALGLGQLGDRLLSVSRVNVQAWLGWLTLGC